MDAPFLRSGYVAQWALAGAVAGQPAGAAVSSERTAGGRSVAAENK
jgi:hypothetical protein